MLKPCIVQVLEFELRFSQWRLLLQGLTWGDGSTPGSSGHFRPILPGTLRSFLSQ